MSRPPRATCPGTWFHVINRGADRQDLFHDDGDHLAFEQLLAESVERFDVEIHAWAQMTNHFHGLVRCDTTAMSAMLHRLCGSYAARYNHRYERTGPLFEGRFRSVQVTTDEQLLQTSRYIHRNPGSIVGSRALANYRWSSLGPYVGTRRSPTWLCTSTLLARFGEDPDAYRAFVESPQPSDAEVGEGERVGTVRLDDVERAVARSADVDVARLRESRRSVVNQPRLAAILLMTERRLATTAEIADRYGMTSPTSVRAAARRARVLRSADPAFATLWQRANDALNGRCD